MKTLKFKDHLVSSILSGKKTTTWRFFDDKELKANDELILINKDTLNNFAKAKIISIKEKKFKDLKEEDFEDHKDFKNKEIKLERFRAYYGDGVNEDVIVKIIKFKLI